MLRGDDVAELQRRLGRLGFDAGRVDGIFGDATAAAVADFQRNVGLAVDGICGPATLAALDRLSAHTRGGSVAEVRERERLRTAPGPGGRLVALGHDGGLDALVATVAKAVAGGGARTISLWQREWSRQAAEANTARADLYLGFSLVPGEARCRSSYYAGHRYRSPAGQHLASLVQPRLAAALDVADLGTNGMSLPVLRETRMPAVLCEIGPAEQVVRRMTEVGAAAAEAVVAWSSSPCEA
jgi:N-acetylmuramoyl-L-alanine amidase